MLLSRKPPGLIQSIPKRVAGYFAGPTGNHMLIRDRDEQRRTEGGPVRCSDVLTRTTVVSRVFADGWE